MKRTRFGRFELVERLGAGGMGEIYVALAGELPGLQKPCALKRIRASLSDRDEFMGRFWDEARVVVALCHPNIVNIYEIGQVDDEYFLAMELVDGHDLWQLLNRAARLNKHFSLRAAVYIARELCAALDYCHELGGSEGPLDLIHRDVSPGNILISNHGRVKLTDFGLAYSAVKQHQTMPRVVYGKPGYLAPEQLVGEPVDRRVDIYAVGVLLFEMLTGERFVQPALDPTPLLRDMDRRSKVAPSSLRRRVPAKLDALVGKALAHDKKRRYGNAGEMLDQLQGMLVEMDPLYGPRRFVSSMLEPLFGKAVPQSLPTELSSPTLVLKGDQGGKTS